MGAHRQCSVRRGMVGRLVQEPTMGQTTVRTPTMSAARGRIIRFPIHPVRITATPTPHLARQRIFRFVTRSGSKTSRR